MTARGPRRWRYARARDLGWPLLRRLRAVPRRPDLLQTALRTLAAVLARGWLRVVHRLRIRGREHVPAVSCVVVANHQSHLDALAVLAALPLARVHRAFPAAAEDYFFTRLPRALVAVVGANALPCPRHGSRGAALRACRAVLRQPGTVLVLFPEGTRSVDGTLGAFRSGIGWLVAGTRVPVVPCAIHGAHEAWPKGARLPRPRAVGVRFGAPLAFDALARDAAGVAQVVQQLRDAVEQLGIVAAKR